MGSAPRGSPGRTKRLRLASSGAIRSRPDGADRPTAVAIRSTFDPVLHGGRCRRRHLVCRRRRAFLSQYLGHETPVRKAGNTSPPALHRFWHAVCEAGARRPGGTGRQVLKWGGNEHDSCFCFVAGAREPVDHDAAGVDNLREFWVTSASGATVADPGDGLRYNHRPHRRLRMPDVAIPEFRP